MMMMKKWLVMVVALAMVAGCGNQKGKDYRDMSEDDEDVDMVEDSSGDETDDEADDVDDDGPRTYAEHMSQFVMVSDTAAKYRMLSQLAQEDLQEIRHSIVTSDTLAHCFWFQDGQWSDTLNPAAFKAMERMIQTSLNYEGEYVYAHEWACQDTVARVFRDYLRQTGHRVQRMDSAWMRRASDDIYDLVKDHDAGSMADFATLYMVLAHLEINKTIGAYKDISALTSDPALRHAYFMDYADWIDYCNSIVLINSWGSVCTAADQTIVARCMCAELMARRREVLQEEMRLLRNGGCGCDWDVDAHPVPDMSADNEVMLRAWYDRRMAYADDISNPTLAEVFRRMTHKMVYVALSSPLNCAF